MSDIWENDTEVSTFYNIHDLILNIIKPSHEIKLTHINKINYKFKQLNKMNISKVPQTLSFHPHKKLYSDIDYLLHYGEHRVNGIGGGCILTIPYLLDDLNDFFVRKVWDEPLHFKLDYCDEFRAFYTLNGVIEDSELYSYYLHLYNMRNNINDENNLSFENKKNSNIRCKGEYFTWRNKVLRRDKDKCVLCGFDKHLHVHHLFSLNKYSVLGTNMGNGITLCKYCHNKFHSFTNKKDTTAMDFINFMKKIGR